MTANEYQKLCLRTLSERDVVLGPIYSRLLHAGLGLATESGEYLDQLKKAFFYGRIVDTTNLLEEVGDVLWYCSLACESMGYTLEDVMAANIRKLTVRYPEKFKDVLNRDEVSERKALHETTSLGLWKEHNRPETD